MLKPVGDGLKTPKEATVYSGALWSPFVLSAYRVLVNPKPQTPPAPHYNLSESLSQTLFVLPPTQL